MANNMKVGVWSPLSGHLPNPRDLEFAQYFVIADGTSAELGITFSRGDWLIYLKTEDGEAHWYQTHGGMVTVSPIGSSSLAPDSGWYTKVFINDNGDITDGDYLQADDLPKHRHDISDIDNVPDKVWDVLKDVFQNQKLGNVKFDVNTNLKKITASVVVDEETIGTNEYGELYALVSGEGGGPVNLSGTTIQISQVENLTAELNQIRSDINNASQSGFFDVNDIPIDEQTITINRDGKLQANNQKNQPHTHRVQDLVDFPEKCLIPASKQTLESDHVDFSNGALNLNGTLDEAIGQINTYLENLTNNITTLQNQSGKIRPNEPHNTSYAKVFITNSKLEVLEKYTKKSTMAYLGPQLKVNISGVYPNNVGALRFFIDEEEVDSLSLQNISVSGTYNNSKVNFVDAYLGNANLEGFYNVVEIDWTCPLNLSSGEHSFYMQHVVNDTYKTQKITFAVVNPHGTLNPTIIRKEVPSNNTFVSGIPCISIPNPNISVKLSIPWQDPYIPKDFISTNISDYEYLPSEDGNIYFQLNKTFEDSNGVKSIFLTLKDFTGNTILNETYASSSLRYDITSCEKYRIINKQTEGYVQYNVANELPTIELPIDNGIVGLLNDYSYYNGPNYTNQSVETVYGKEVREITFAIPCSDFINSFYVDLETKDGASFASIKGKLQGIIICACLTNSVQPNYWVNTLNNFDGISNFESDNFGALDLARSTEKRKYITFGRRPLLHSGTLFVKFLLENNVTLNIEKAVNSIVESIKESLC